MFGIKKIRKSLFIFILSTCALVFLVGQHLNHLKHEHVRSVSQKQRLVFPTNGSDDRIKEQLEYKPISKKIKTILLFDEQNAWKAAGVKPGKEMFESKKCPVDTCVISFNPKNLKKSDLVITRGVLEKELNLKPEQLWMVYQLESSQSRPLIAGNANWTATYRRDSTLSTPYGKWEPSSDDVVKTIKKKDYGKGREGKVAWMVSNCHANNKRLEFARKLGQYIPVDIIGACGPGEIKCPKGKKEECWKMIAAKYKFYLSFENSNCQDYITEKFWDALKYKVLPIAMGAREEDYHAVAPAHSFIHVDEFTGPKELATYLLMLDKNSEKYNSYFNWVGAGMMVDTKFFCRTCALLHHPHPPPFHSDILEWWDPSYTCTPTSWTDTWSL